MSEKRQKIEKIRRQKKRSKRAKEKILEEKRNVSCEKKTQGENVLFDKNIKRRFSLDQKQKIINKY
jgi:hypothetical protein